MPTYQYQCGDCGEELEIFQSMKDPTLKKCPSCGKNALKRRIGTGAGIIFKGSGFYCTDYRSENYKKAQVSSTSEKKADSAKPSGETASGKAKSPKA